MNTGRSATNQMVQLGDFKLNQVNFSTQIFVNYEKLSQRINQWAFLKYPRVKCSDPVPPINGRRFSSEITPGSNHDRDRRARSSRRGDRVLPLPTFPQRDPVLLSQPRMYLDTVLGTRLDSFSFACRHMMMHTGSRPHTCPHCPFSSRLPLHLRRHMRVHTGAKPYKCPHCPYQCNVMVSF